MPIHLDACITGIFVPGNIGASSGQPPVVRLVPPRAPAVVAAAIVEAAAAAAIQDFPVYAVAVAETATAADTVSAVATTVFTADVAEPATADSAQNATIVSFAVWDTGTVTAVTLSGGNLVATNTGTTSANQGAHVISTSGKTTGKYYFEVTFTTLTGGGNYGIGIGTAASTYSNMGANATTGNMMFRSGNIYANGTSTGSGLGARSAGNVIGVAVDLDNRMIWYRHPSNPSFWNSNSTATNNPATNVGGIAIPAGTMVPFVTFGGTGGAINNVLTANFGAAAFGNAAPSGFTVGWPT